MSQYQENEFHICSFCDWFTNDAESFSIHADTEHPIVTDHQHRFVIPVVWVTDPIDNMTRVKIIRCECGEETDR